MNYLYEHQGLFDLSGHIQLDFSQGALPALHENALADGASLTTPPYRRAWYAPFYRLDGTGHPVIDPNTQQKIISPLVASQGAAKATRFCGKSFGAGDPLTEMARVVSPSFDAQTGSYIDWDGDGQPDNPSPAQDVNFDGLGQSLPPSYSDTFTGYNDWANIRLDQISANGLKGGLEDLVFLDDEFISLTGDDEFISLTGDDEYISLTGDDEFISLTGDDEFISLTGDDEYINLTGDDEYINLTGDDENTYKGTQELGAAAPYELVACIVGEPGCFNQVERKDLPDLSGVQPFTPQCTTGLQWAGGLQRSGTSITTRCSGRERTLPTAATQMSEILDLTTSSLMGTCCRSWRLPTGCARTSTIRLR